LTVSFDAPESGAALAAAIRNARRVAAICHENPDGDTVGGAIAMALISERLGTPAEVVSADGVPAVFEFLPLVRDVRPSPSADVDLAVICDAATLERVGGIAREHADWFATTSLVNVDHHVTNAAFGTLNIVDPAAAATCEVIAEMLPHIGVTADADIATALMTGIVRDSHGFAAAATRPKTLHLAADLLEAGANLADIHRRILAEMPYATMSLWGQLLTASRAAADGRIVYTTLMPSMLEETGTSQEDADGLAEFLANTRGAAITILFRELGPKETRVSFRVKHPVDATALARPFGGGGHVARAGCTVDGPASEAVGRVLAVCQDHLEELALGAAG
jgi:phosphoesterase RecJ-like protein